MPKNSKKYEEIPKIHKGTQCKCSDCGKVWTINEADLERRDRIKKNIQHKQGLDNMYNVAQFLNNPKDAYSKMSLNQAGTYAYALYESKNLNEDMLQSKFCPFCRQFNITTSQFSYKTDENGEFAGYYTEEEELAVLEAIKAAEERKAQEKKELRQQTWELIKLTFSLQFYCQIALGIVQALIFREQLSKEGVKINIAVSALYSVIAFQIIGFENVMNGEIFQILETKGQVGLFIFWSYLIFEAVIHIVFISDKHRQIGEEYNRRKRERKIIDNDN